MASALRMTGLEILSTCQATVLLQGLQIIVTLFAVAALSLHFVQGRLSAPKDAGGYTGATEEVVTIICNPP